MSDELELPGEVYAAEADWVRLAMKRMTARRMVNWLRGFALYMDQAENDVTADHARAVAARLEAEVEPEEVRTDGGEDELPEFEGLDNDTDDDHDPSTLPCWDCEKEITQREAAWAEVMDHDTVDGMGYETYDAPLCHHCYRKRLPSHECGTCGREYPDLEMAATCCPEGVMEGPI